MQKVVGIKYSPEGKAYYFSANGLDLNVNDKVIVDTINGEEFGIVDFKEREVNNSAVVGELKPVLRLASKEDEKRRKDLDDKAKKAVNQIKEMVKDLKLEMKITSVMFTFDGSKLIIEFTAEDRVDFRELLKVLANNFRVRIELKQIGQRDEVKSKGAIGQCGQVCCCKRFLNDFEHVSVKMAKNQGISLTPTKINGICGRLLCCLAYENPTYEAVLAKMPKVNQQVTTPKGNGTVVFNDVLRELVSVKFAQNDGSFGYETFNLSDIKFKKEGGKN